jgi:hypothetical protein
MSSNTFIYNGRRLPTKISSAEEEHIDIRKKVTSVNWNDMVRAVHEIRGGLFSGLDYLPILNTATEPTPPDAADYLWSDADGNLFFKSSVTDLNEQLNVTGIDLAEFEAAVEADILAFDGRVDDAEVLAAATAASTASVVAALAITKEGIGLNVKDFGAVGNGATDDTAAIQLAIDAAAAAGGGVVVFPPGVYLISAPLDIINLTEYDFAKNITLRGVPKPGGSTNGNMSTLSWFGPHVGSDSTMIRCHSRNCQIENLQLLANVGSDKHCNRAIDINYPGASAPVPTAVQGLHSPCTDIVMKDIEIYGDFTYGVVIGDLIGGASANNMENIRFERVNIQGYDPAPMTACCFIPNTSGQIKHLSFENCAWSPTGGSSQQGYGLLITGRASGTWIGNGPSYCETGISMETYTADYWHFQSLDSEGCGSFCRFLNAGSADMQLTFSSCRFSCANIVGGGAYMVIAGGYEVLMDACAFSAQPAGTPLVLLTGFSSQSTRLTTRRCSFMNNTETLIEEPGGQNDNALLVFDHNTYIDPTTGTVTLFDDYKGPASWFSPKTRVQTDATSGRQVLGQVSIRHLTTAPLDADMSAADLAFYRSESAHSLNAKVKYADGATVKTVAIPFGSLYAQLATNASDPTPTGVTEYLWADTTGRPYFKDNTSGRSRSLLRRSFFDVKDYGALGDNSNDDTAEIQAAINACAAIGGGTVYFPAGIYKITSTLYIINTVAFGSMVNIRLLGAAPAGGSGVGQAELRWYGVDPTATILKIHSRDCTVEDLYLHNPDNANRVSKFIDINYPGASLVPPVHYQGAASPCTNNKLKRVVLQGCGDHGISIGDEIPTDEEPLYPAAGGPYYASNCDHTTLEAVVIHGTVANPMLDCLYCPNMTNNVKDFFWYGGQALPNGANHSPSGVGINITGRLSGLFEGILISGADECIHVDFGSDMLLFRHIDTEGCGRLINLNLGSSASRPISIDGLRADIQWMEQDTGRYIIVNGSGNLEIRNALFEGLNYRIASAFPMQITVAQNIGGSGITLENCTLNGSTDLFEQFAEDGHVTMRNCTLLDPDLGTYHKLDDYKGPRIGFTTTVRALAASSSVSDVISRPTTFTAQVTAGPLFAATLTATTVAATNTVAGAQGVFTKDTGVGSFAEYPLVINYGRDTDIGVAGMENGLLYNNMNAAGTYEPVARIAAKTVLANASDMMSNLIFEIRARGASLITNSFGLYSGSTGIVSMLVGTNDTTDFVTAGQAKVLFQHGSSKMSFREQAAGNTWLAVSNGTQYGLFQAYQGDVTYPAGMLFSSSEALTFNTNSGKRISIATTGAIKMYGPNATSFFDITTVGAGPQDAKAGGGNILLSQNASADTASYASVEARNNDALGAEDGLALLCFGRGYTTAGAYMQDGSALVAGTSIQGGLNLVAKNASLGYLRFYTGGSADGNLRAQWSPSTGVLYYNCTVNQKKGSDIASFTTITLPLDGNVFTVTGVATIDHIGDNNWASSAEIILIFSGAATVAHNTAAPPANHYPILLNGSVPLVCSANTVLKLVFDGSNWQEVSRKVP